MESSVIKFMSRYEESLDDLRKMYKNQPNSDAKRTNLFLAIHRLIGIKSRLYTDELTPDHIEEMNDEITHLLFQGKSMS